MVRLLLRASHRHALYSEDTGLGCSCAGAEYSQHSVVSALQTGTATQSCRPPEGESGEGSVGLVGARIPELRPPEVVPPHLRPPRHLRHLRHVRVVDDRSNVVVYKVAAGKCVKW